MTNSDELNNILDRIVKGTYSDQDIIALRQLHQHGKFIVNLGEGKDIHFGDRIYQGTDAETIQEVFRNVLQEGQALPGQTKPLALTGADGLGKLSNVPELPQNFLSRPEVLKTLKALVSKSFSPMIAVVSKSRKVGVQGMGGIGKSVLTAALARDKEIRRQFPNGIVWVSLGQNPVITSRQAQIYTALTGKPIEFKDEQDGRARLSELLAEDIACLIILDDVWKLEHVNAFNAIGDLCRMVITTRDTGIVSTFVPQKYRYQLDVLSKDQALQLLAQVSEQALETLPEEAQTVAEECGYLPLALAMAGGMVKGKPYLWKGVLKRLQNADLEKIEQQFPDYPYHDLLRAIQVSVDALEEHERERYLDFAVFPEDTPIPIAVLQVLWESEGLDEMDANMIVSTLIDRSLVQQNDQGGLILHDLLLDYVRKQVENLPNMYKRFSIPASAIKFIQQQVLRQKVESLPTLWLF